MLSTMWLGYITEGGNGCGGGETYYNSMPGGENPQPIYYNRCSTKGLMLILRFEPSQRHYPSTNPNYVLYPTWVAVQDIPASL